jgi:hypothetical protein
MPTGAERRRHQDEAAKSEKEDVTLNLLLKHLNATLAPCNTLKIRIFIN